MSTERVGRAVLEFSTEAKDTLATVGAIVSALEKAKGVGHGAGAGFKDAGDNAGGMTGMLKGALGTLTGFVGAQAVIAGVSKAFSFAKESVFGMNATLESTTLQFETLMGDSERAKQHVKDLFEFAKNTPFETGPIIEASRHLQVFGGDALNTKNNLALVGDAAAATGAPIEQVAFWVGRMHANLAQNKPVGEAIQNLTQLGVVSPQTATQLEKVAKSGKSVEEKFKVMQQGLGAFTGAMEKQAGTWSGLTSTFADTLNLLVSGAFKPFFELSKELLKSLNDILGSDEFATKAQALGEAVSQYIVVGLRFAKDAFQVLVSWAQNAQAAFGDLSGVFSVVGEVWAYIVDLGKRLWGALSQVHVSSGALSGIWEHLKSVIGGLWKALTLIVDIVVAVATKLHLMQGITVLVQGVMYAFTGVLGKVGDALGWVADKIRWMLEAVGLLDKNIAPPKAKLESVADKTLPAVATGAADAAGAVGTFGQAAKTAGVSVAAFGDDSEKAEKKAKAFRESLRELSADVGKGLKTLTDAEFEKEFGDKLRSMERDLKLLGKTGTEVPANIRAGLDRLRDIDLSKWARDQASQLQAAIADPLKELPRITEDAELQAIEAVGKSLATQKAAREDLAKTQRAAALSTADYEIEQAKRAGKSKQVIADMERGISLQKLQFAIEDANAEFKAKVDALDRSSVAYRETYAALEEAHKAHVAQLVAEWNQGQDLMVTKTKTSWMESLSALADAFGNLGAIGGTALGNLTRGIGTMITSVDTAFKSVGALKTGWGSMTSGGGLKSILGGISSIASGIGGWVSLISSAISGIGALVNHFRGGEEGVYVNPNRDRFVEQFGGSDRMDMDLTRALEQLGDTDAGNTAHRLVTALARADKVDSFKAAEQAIADVFGQIGRNVQVFHAGGMVPGWGEVNARLLGGERVLNRGDADAYNRDMAQVPRDLLRGLSGQGVTEQTIILRLDGRELARTVVRGMPRELSLQGLV